MTARIVALCNQKGGVGKTTLTVNLAEAMAAAGKRVLLIDADPQANATTHLGIEDAATGLTLNDVLTVQPATRRVIAGAAGDAVRAAGEGWSENLQVIPSELALAGREQDQDLGREYRLREALDGTLDRWDVVVIDCPPSLGQLTINALAAADSALLITEPRAASVDGLAQIAHTLGLVQQHYNGQLTLAGIVVNRHHPQRKDRADWVETLREQYKDLLLEPFVPERELVAQAASAGAPLSAFGPKAAGAVEVMSQLADVVDRTAVPA